MPSIGPPTPIPAPPGANYFPDRLSYASPDGKWTLVYHTPREWHMDATGWQARLLRGRRDVTREHQEFLRVAGDRGFRGERNFQPWSRDNASLAFVTWDDEPVFVYEIANKKAVHLPYRRPYISAAQFAPDMDRLLIASAADGLLVDHAGNERQVVRWGIARDTATHTFWMTSGRCFVLLALARERASAVLSFFRGDDGSLLESRDFNPSDLVPYDVEQYAGLPRNGLSLTLVNPPGVQAVGLLLDTWSDVRFDQASNTLSLSVLRPVSPPVKENGALRCRVDSRWVAVRLGD
jgi:hypothetical protein